MIWKSFPGTNLHITYAYWISRRFCYLFPPKPLIKSTFAKKHFPFSLKFYSKWCWQITLTMNQINFPKHSLQKFQNVECRTHTKELHVHELFRAGKPQRLWNDCLIFLDITLFSSLWTVVKLPVLNFPCTGKALKRILPVLSFPCTGEPLKWILLAVTTESRLVTSFPVSK